MTMDSFCTNLNENGQFYFNSSVEKALLGVSFCKVFLTLEENEVFTKLLWDDCVPCCNLNLSLHWIS